MAEARVAALEHELGALRDELVQERRRSSALEEELRLREPKWAGQGDVSARIEAEYELLLTQRLILQPRTELNFAVQSVPEYGVGSGLSTAELSARLRYEVKREFAPYIGIDWTRSVGETADFVRADGGDPSSVSFVAGLRLWF